MRNTKTSFNVRGWQSTSSGLMFDPLIQFRREDRFGVVASWILGTGGRVQRSQLMYINVVDGTIPVGTFVSTKSFGSEESIQRCLIYPSEIRKRGIELEF